ncbi:MAG TPA: O-antigen polymerase [Silvibacterium sp.]|nr:O-antigen polymerase [Silvibacterium sp.]
MKVNIERIARPSGIAIVAVALSFGAWLFPDFGLLRKGFTVAEYPGLTSLFILFSWYLLIFTGFSIGERLGTPSAVSRRKRNNLPPLNSQAVYWTFTVLSAIGVIATFFRIFHTLPFQQAILYIYLGQANRLKNTLYNDYGAGILSLRYLVLYSASLAIYRIGKFKRLSFIAVVNIALLAMTALLSSRLILIATVLVSAFLLNYGKKTIKIGIVKLMVLTGIIFAVLSLLNYSRNSNFYSGRNLSFTEASLSEIVTYLGSPFQVSIGAAKRMDEIAGETPESYREFVDVEESLTTNSAFVHLHEQMGYLSWLYIGALCCFMGFMFSWLASFGKTSLLLPCGAILYGAAELWRLDLFQQGIFIVWFVMGIGVPGVVLFFDGRPVPGRSTFRSARRPATGHALRSTE